VLRHVIVTDPDLAGDDGVIGNLVTMVWDGRNLLDRLLRWVLKMSADHPRALAELREVATSGTAAQGATVDAFAKRFVLETMRMRLPAFNYRRVVRDISIGPYRVPKGWLIRICRHEAHCSSDVSPAPDEFNPPRFAKSSGPSEFCPFSEGPHSCPAEGFAMAVAETFVLRLALAFEVRAVRDGPAWRPNRHWAYWVPSADFRLELAALGRPPGAAHLGGHGWTV
jgi:cytochrome P450